MQKEGAINMNLNIDSIVGKIESNADKVGLGLGAYMELNRFAKEWKQYGVTDPLSAAMKIIERLLSDPHIPNLEHLKQSLFSPTGTFKPAATAAIIGYFLKEVDVMPQLTRLGNALMKAGVGAAEATTVIQLLVWSGAGHSPSGGEHFEQNQNANSGVPMGPRSVSLATSYREIPIGGAF